jgi:polyisoprenoid-binding protein YceI
MLTKSFLLAAFVSLALSAPAPHSFNFKDPKGVSGLTFSIDSNLEPIMGGTSAVDGTVNFDPAKPENSSGKIIVQAAKVEATSDGLTGPMIGPASLDAEKYPTIEFEFKKVSNVKKGADGVYSADVTGNFTLCGITKELKVKATATHVIDGLQKRGGLQNKKGDLLVVRSKFSFKRTDFKVAPDVPTFLIGDQVNVDLAIAGYIIK